VPANFFYSCYFTFLLSSSYCFFLASGGTQILVNGTNLNSAASPEVKLTNVLTRYNNTPPETKTFVTVVCPTLHRIDHSLIK
jgi:hypothetical protein